MGLRVLFLTPNPIEAANTRYRIHQYLPYLEARGFHCEISPFLSPRLFHELYRPGRTMSKIAGLAWSTLVRIADAARAGRFDLIYISREAMLFGPPVIEWFLDRIKRRPIVFDFDDAIFVSYLSPTYGRMATWLKYPQKFETILQMSSRIVAGNEYLANYARQHNPRVSIIPTVVDPDLYAAGARRKEMALRSGSPPLVGWIGTHSTAQYLHLVAPALSELGSKGRLRFRVIGSGEPVSISNVEVENREWDLSREIQDFADLDIGLYPIQDDKWARGKCAFKAIQYMAAGVPCIASPVGMNCEVIMHGINGFLAESASEWILAIQTLLREPDTGRRLARAGAATVRERYSLATHAPRLADVLEQAAAES